MSSRRQKEAERKRKREERSCKSLAITDTVENSCDAVENDFQPKDTSLQSSYSITETEPFHGLHVQPETVFSGYIDINILDFVSIILKGEYQQHKGLLQPSYLYAMSESGTPLPNHKLIPVEGTAVQLHFISNHFVVSYQSIDKITVLDSLPNANRTNQLRVQLSLLFTRIRIDQNYMVEYVVPQNQGYTSDCGCFAVSFAVMLLKGIHPSSRKLIQPNLRQYLYNGLTSGSFSVAPPFVITDRSNSAFLTQSELRMNTYFKSQQQLAAHKMQKRNFDEMNSEKQLSKSRMKIWRQQRTEATICAEKDKDKDRKKTKRGQRIEEKQVLDKQKDKDRKEMARCQRNKEQVVLDKEKDKGRKKMARGQREEQVLDKQKDKDRKEMARCQRNKEQVVLDKEKDKGRKKMARGQREEQVMDKQKDKDRKEMARGQRTKEREVVDKEKDKGRKKMTRGQRTKEREVVDKEKDKGRKKMTRGQRTKEQEVVDKEKDQGRKEMARGQRTKEQVVVDKEKDKYRKDVERKECRNVFESSSHAEPATGINYLTPGVEHVLAVFNNRIKCGPTFQCTSCERWMYRDNVVHIHENAYQKLPIISRDKLFENQTKWVCKTCHKSLAKGKIPNQSKLNNLNLCTIPKELKDLSLLEHHLISRIIPFMKILSKPRGAQHGINGPVVLVPSDLNKVTSVLPRITSESQIIMLALKRRLLDKNTVEKQYIRPSFVNKALSYLVKNSSVYSDISVNSTWSAESAIEDPELWDAVTSMEGTSTSQMVEEEDASDSEDDVEKDNPFDVQDRLQNERSVNSQTCLLPQDGPSIQMSDIVNIAPGEGQRPVSEYRQPRWEEMAFPHLFPDAQNTFNTKRCVRLSQKKYVNQRLLNCDGRFAESTEYIFQSLHWLESVQLQNCISITQRKTQEKLTVGQLRNPLTIRGMLSNDQLFATFKTLRGTPQYWHQMQMDMLAKLRQLGPYTFFLTASAAEFHWTEVISAIAKQYGQTLTDGEINSMDWQTKKFWLQRNPVTAARQINYIFDQLWGKVILSGAHPIGQILNYDRRIEMQGRGTAHFHAALHVKDAPKLDVNTDEEVIQFIDKNISCAIPDRDEDPVLYDLVTSRQIHHHTRTCTKKRGCSCRFSFPRAQSDKTSISRPTDDKSGCLKTTQKVSVILKRTTGEGNVNNYNPILLRAIRANMDIQFITNIWACIAYLTSYMCKPERTMSELMKKACKEASNKSIRDKLYDIGHLFLKAREVSEHEAITRVLSMPLRKSNVTVTFVPTDFKEKRTRILKPVAVIENMKDEDEDVYLPSVLDKYAARPASLEETSLAAFVANYAKKTQNKDDEEDITVSEVESDETSSFITLQNGLGKMYKRKYPCVIRYHFVSKEKDPEMYYHRLLLLYLPWRSEEELKVRNSYESKFEVEKLHILGTIQQFEPFCDTVEDVLDTFDPNDTHPDTWIEMTPESEQDLLHCDNSQPDPDYAFLNPAGRYEETQQTIKDQRSSSTFTYGLANKYVPDDDFLEIVRSLNLEQRKLFDFIYQWSTKTRLSSGNDAPDPFYIFLSGGAGVGKSHTINAVYQGSIRALRSSNICTDSVLVVLTASTGKAASNIQGVTVHSAFALPVRQISKLFEYRKLSSQKLNTLRSMYVNLKIIITDEISMFGARSLTHLSRALQDIFEKPNVPFGGLSVLVVGDLLQLNPVGDLPVFKSVTQGYNALCGSLWARLFSLHELTEIVRQKGDPEFADLLSRVRVGECNDSDLQKVQELENTDISGFPVDTVHLFFTNQQANEYNMLKLATLDKPIITIMAQDSRKDLLTNSTDVHVMSKSIYETGNLPSQLDIAVGARFLLTKNIDTPNHLVNGATGIVKLIDIDKDKPLQGTLFVKFDDEQCGLELKKQSPQHFSDCVPIKSVTAQFMLCKQTPVPVERRQFPGVLAFGITVHKSQGSTYKHMHGDLSTLNPRVPIPQGLVYTMLSRATSRSGVKLTAFSKQKIKVNKSALEEMERLRKENVFQWKHPVSSFSRSDIVIGQLNVRSLRKHFSDIQEDHSISCVSVFCVCETHLPIWTEPDQYALKGYSTVLSNTQHGLGMFIKSDFNFRILPIPSSDIQAMACLVNLAIPLLVVTIYRQPNTPMRQFLFDLDGYLQSLPMEAQTTTVCGDFNVHQTDRWYEHLETVMTKHNLEQTVFSPTHTHGGVLDLMFSTPGALVTTTFPVPYSDHHIVFGKIDC